jgi:ABC-type antimicrobial peptide transport system permease subunit
MIKNYLKIALRNLISHKVFSFINIFGLAVGMACTILIVLWVQDELSFDRFHKNADNTYLVLRGDKEGPTAVTSKMLASALKGDLPEIQKSTNLIQLPESFKFLIQNGTKGFEESVVLVNPNFFEIFSFKFKEGNPATALSAPNSILLTEEAAKKYFGNENAIGKPLDVSGFGGKTVMNVSGILENLPLQSHIQCHIILPANWFTSIGINFDHWEDQSFRTYIQLKDNSDLQSLSSKIKQCEIKNYPNQNTQNLSYSLIPLTKIHLYGSNIKFMGPTGDIKYIRIFMAIAVIILLIASINYMNLSTALSLKRTKEVGIKKAVGANRNTLIRQFFGESIILSLIAYSLAILFVELFLHKFNLLSGKNLVIRFFEPSFMSLSVIVTIVTGLISGCYPALFLSSFSPVQILKGKLKLSTGNLFTRKGLVISQFVISIIMIVCTIVVINQLTFIRNSKLGFDKENLLCIKMTGDSNSKYDVLRNEFLKNPEIVSVSRSEPVSSEITRTIGVSWKGKPENEEKHFFVLHSDYNLAATYKFEMSQGRYFSDQYPTDKINAFVVNEAAVKSMELKSPLDNEIQLWGKKGKIIGVTKDFHFASFHTAIEPLIFTIPDDNQQAGRFRVITLRFKSQTPDNLISSIEKIWHEQMAGNPFDYYFYDDALNKQYFSEMRMGTIFKYFSFLSIVIACLGLFGLVSISAEQRTKEIGIRKVSGSSISNVAFILSKDFLILVIISNVIAWPVAYYSMNKWLQDFAYRIDISWWVFALAGLLALGTALLTVSWQSWRAATRNPVEALRYE